MKSNLQNSPVLYGGAVDFYLKLIYNLNIEFREERK
jgi:hypothetical protein